METIFLNQIGYAPSSKKKATLNASADNIYLVDAHTGKALLSFPVVFAGYSEGAGEETWEVNFSALKTPGEYRLVLEDARSSALFTVGYNVLSGLRRDLMRMFYFQRCGTELTEECAGVFHHPFCHMSLARSLPSASVKRDLTGGWHDAGDYGRYVGPGAVALSHLLYAFEMYPQVMSGTLDIPESGGSLPDVLAECKWELDWLLKMQDGSGGAYHKLTTYQHSSFIMPEKDLGELFYFPVSSMATGNLVAIMAQAARVYAPYDAQYAQKLKASAQLGWRWLQDNPRLVSFTNPKDCNTGEYGDNSDLDERLWAAAEMKRLMGAEFDAGDLEAALKKVGSSDLGWANVGGLALFSVLTDPANTAGEAVKSQCEQSLRMACDYYLALSDKEGYGVAMSKDDYVWGSNMLVLNRGMLLMLGASALDNEAYSACASRQMDYLLGCNALGVSYVTGWGEGAYTSPHNRPLVAKPSLGAIPGQVSGGPNGVPADPKAQRLLRRVKAPMKSYVDNWECYSVNEITIYWNSPAVFLAAAIEANQ